MGSCWLFFFFFPVKEKLEISWFRAAVNVVRFLPWYMCGWGSEAPGPRLDWDLQFGFPAAASGNPNQSFKQVPGVKPSTGSLAAAQGALMGRSLAPKHMCCFPILRKPAEGTSSECLQRKSPAGRQCTSWFSPALAKELRGFDPCNDFCLIAAVCGCEQQHKQLLLVCYWVPSSVAPWEGDLFSVSVIK